MLSFSVLIASTCLSSTLARAANASWSSYVLDLGLADLLPLLQVCDGMDSSLDTSDWSYDDGQR